MEKVTTNTNLFMDACPSRKLIGVTGTKGKGTTSSLLTEILKATGHTVHLGGNIGTPPLQMLEDGIGEQDWVVLELANFQLIDIKYSPPIAVCLMVVPEHLDWHADTAEYVRAKQQLFRWQSPEDTTIYFEGNELTEQVVSVAHGKKIPYFREPGAFIKDRKVVIDDTVICDVEDIRLLGEHNWQNVCAAVTTVWSITEDVNAIRQAIKNFGGLPYRLEPVRELNGVRYYNDSFGTTPETAIVAIKSLDEPKVLILGGSDKGSDYTELARTVANSKIRHVITIGGTGPAIAKAISDISDVPLTLLEGRPEMTEIVNTASDLAQVGDVVLLSTGCASFGMFANYKDRGDRFNQAVRALV